MQKVIVPVDFSTNSRAGVRFAIQLASQHPMKLIFFHVIELLIPNRWNDSKSRVHQEQEIARKEQELNKFVKDIYRQAGLQPQRHMVVVKYGSPVDLAIVDQATGAGASFICMSTRGAGRVRKLIGTYTSMVIKHSAVPVFVIPGNYKRQTIDHILYASDMTNLGAELKRVQGLARLIRSKVSVLHYEYLLEVKDIPSQLPKEAKNISSSRTKFYLERFDFEYPFAKYLRRAMAKHRPSVVALFTQQNKTWLQRLFWGSRSAELSFDVKRPLVVFPK